MEDERYFELKYNINLLKAVSAILIFIIGFIGYTSIDNLTGDIREDINKVMFTQNEQINNLEEKIRNLIKSLDTLETFNEELNNLIGSNKADFSQLSSKVNQVNESFKCNPRIYIVNNLEFNENQDREGFRVYFGELKTIFDDPLPKFQTPPYINIEARGFDLESINTTTDYVDLAAGVSYIYNDTQGNEIGKDGKFRFDLWFAAFE